MFVVIRGLTLLGLFLVAGCGGSAAPEARPKPSSPPLTSQPAPPKTPRPKITFISDGPPPAWLETEGGSVWLGYSSYCWRTACVDFISPSCRDPKHTPGITLRRGERVTAHLPFRPTELGLTIVRERGASSATKQKGLPVSSTPSWIAKQPGPFSLLARVKGGDASYVGCIEFR